MSVPQRNILVFLFFCIGFVSSAFGVKMYELHGLEVSLVASKPTEDAGSSMVIVDAKVLMSSETVIAQTPIDVSRSGLEIVHKPAKPKGLPGVTAQAYIVGDVETGEVYLAYNSLTALPVASMSKLVTAFVATRELSFDKTVKIDTYAADAPPDKSLLKEGEVFTVSELMQPLLLSSSNVAAEALVSQIDRTGFLELMSSYAWEIGMPSTFFADPSGVSPLNIASAKDLFALARYLYTSQSDILALTRVAHADIATSTEHGSHSVTSTHPFVNDPRFIGGKTGRTPEAGDTMLTILNLEGRPVAIVVLGSRYEGRAKDTQLLVQKVEDMMRN
jgi:D-alanyl-D-alanine carboxypeptidase